MDSLYVNIRNRRKELGMSQVELAMRCGYKDHTTINKIEAGKVDISVGRLKQIAQILDISVVRLMGLEDE